MQIRAATPGDFAALVDLWLASVRKTHRFLKEENIQALLPAVREYLSGANGLWVVELEGVVAGFMGVTGPAVDSLFLAPDWLGRGVGKALIAHARSIAPRPLTVDVDEQNPDALAFYLASGFEIIGRSDTDDAGRPYPLLHLREKP